jgi:hypothetical protein
MNDRGNAMKLDENPQEDPVQLLKEVYSCIGSAISTELEHENYKEIERLKALRRKIEKIIL